MPFTNDSVVSSSWDSAPLVGAGADLLSGVANVWSTIKTNKDNIKYSKEAYAKQYQDQLDFWRMQNAYNTPEQQMKRFSAAGLNPNLVYGRGDSGNAGSLSAPSMHSLDLKAPRFDAGGVLGAYYDTKAKQAQVNNLGAQNDLLRNSAALKKAQAVNAVTQGMSDKMKLKAYQALGGDTYFASLFGANNRKVHADAFASEKNASLLLQRYNQLQKTNPIQYAQLSKALEAAGYSTDKLRKEANLIGLSDKTELGSLLRFLFTFFNIDVGHWAKFTNPQ